MNNLDVDVYDNAIIISSNITFDVSKSDVHLNEILENLVQENLKSRQVGCPPGRYKLKMVLSVATQEDPPPESEGPPTKPIKNLPRGAFE